MMISVALCTYNGAKYLRDQLDSLSSQYVLPDELIICDDGSKDHTLEIIESFRKNAPFAIKLFVNRTTLGTTKNFENALSYCSGDIIFLCDQDDIWLPDKLATVCNFFENNIDIDVVFTDGYVVDNEKNIITTLWDGIGFSEKEQSIWRSGGGLNRLLKNNNVATGATMALRARFLKDAIPFPSFNFWIHDGIITVIAASIEKLAFINEKLIYYRKHDQQQIGIKKYEPELRFHILKRLKSGRKLPSDAAIPLVLQDLKSFKQILDRINQNETYPHDLEKKTKHYEQRNKLVQLKLVPRLSLVFWELIKGNYFKYSSNKAHPFWFYILKDCIGVNI